MPDFSQRTLIPERMDADTVAFEDYSDCLRDLETVNQWTLAYRPTLGFLDRLHATGLFPRDRPVTIIDVGCGGGDMLRRVDRWAVRRGVAVELAGIDRDMRAIRVALKGPRPRHPARWDVADCFDYRPARPVDLIVSSLFAHHLDDSELVRFLGWMDATARMGWFVNDLHRHPVAYYGFAVLSRLMRWHRFVRHDGPVSITRAFVAADWQLYLARADIPAGGVRIKRWLPFRLCLARVKAP